MDPSRLYRRNGRPLEPFQSGFFKSAFPFHGGNEDDFRLSADHLLQTDARVGDRLVLCHVPASGKPDQIMMEGLPVHRHDGLDLDLNKNQRLSQKLGFLNNAVNPACQFLGLKLCSLGHTADRAHFLDGFNDFLDISWVRHINRNPRLF